MIAPKVRSIAANLITKGAIIPVSNEIVRAFEGGGAGATARDLKTIQMHAVHKVPFYFKYRNVPFLELPIIDKNMMREQLSDFLSEDSEISKLASASTSGSTGIPFTSYFDKGKAYRRSAGVVANYRFMNVDPFGPLVFCRAWGNLSVKQRALLAAKGHFPFAGVQEGRSHVDETVRWIKKNAPVTIMGYTSYIEGFLRVLEEENIELPPGAVTGVVGASEAATDYFEEAVQRVIGVSARMKYSNMELGIMGLTSSDIGIYHIDTSSFHIEILQENADVAAPAGEDGRIVVTDLHNQAMPFLRYDTGDIGRFAQDEEGKIIPGQLTELKGRKVDVLVGGPHENPRRLHALQIWGPTSKIHALRQFQLKQHGVGRFTWILNAERSSELERQLEEILLSVVESVSQCSFIYTEAVPVTASGKRQFFVNEMPDEDLCRIAE